MRLLERLCYLTIFLIPTYLIRFELFGVPTNVLEVLVGFTLLLWIIKKFQTSADFEHWNLGFVWKLAFRRRRSAAKAEFGNKNLTFGQNLVSRFARNWKLSAGVLLLFFGLALGIFISLDTRTSLGALKGWFLVPLAFFVVARSVLDTKAKKEKALWSLALSGISVALIGFFYWVQGNVTFDGRLAGFYESPNMMAMYLAPALLIITLVLNEKLKSKSEKSQFKIQNYLTIFYFTLLLFILLLTSSLGVFIGVGTVLLFYFSTIRWGKHWEKLGRTIGIVIIFLGILVPFSSLLFDPWDMGRTSIASRLMIWQASVEMLNDNWLLGIGPGTFQETYLSYQKNFSPFLEWAVPHPHNIFLTTWLYAGLPGLIGFLLILFWFFKIIRTKPSTLNPIPFVMLYLLIHGFIDNTLWRNDGAMIFWLITALMFKADR